MVRETEEKLPFGSVRSWTSIDRRMLGEKARLLTSDYYMKARKEQAGAKQAGSLLMYVRTPFELDSSYGFAMMYRDLKG
jgi:hypothetical protein